MIERGSVHVVDFGDPRSSAPGQRRLVVVVQSDRLNRSLLATAIVVILASNTDLAAHPGNGFLPASAIGLDRDSVANVTQVASLDRAAIGPPLGSVPDYPMAKIEQGLRLVLELRAARQLRSASSSSTCR